MRKEETKGSAMWRVSGNRFLGSRGLPGRVGPLHSRRYVEESGDFFFLFSVYSSVTQCSVMACKSSTFTVENKCTLLTCGL